jgi:uncharacterized repeat protein (TIGR02543 family)
MNIKQTINSFSAWTVDRLTSARRATLTMLATFLIAMTAQTAWADNDPIGSINYNSELGAYEIKNVNNLNDLAVYVNGSGAYSNTGETETVKHNCDNLTFKMTADITFPNTGDNNFTIIGDNDRFNGTFDGQGFTISGIKINRPESDDIGIFGLVGNTVGEPIVKNLVVSNCSIVGSGNVGVIAGYLIGKGIIENCHVGDDVTLNGKKNIGGIVGTSHSFGTIRGCTCAATITGTTYGGIKANALGGIVGYTPATEYQKPSLTNNIFTGAITGGDNLGELIGAIVGNNESGILTNNVHTSTVLGGIGASGSTTGADGDGANNYAKRAYTITGGEKVTVDFNGGATITYSPNGISVYGAGMKYANTLYVDGNAAVDILLSSDDPVNSYSASAGTLNGSANTGTNDAYTLTMTNPASNSTITADFALWGEKDGADGSEAKPYIIKTTAGLDKLAQKVNAGGHAVVNGFSGKFFKLGDNIAYDKNTANNFTPIGDGSGCSFCGTFDGDGKTISGININSGSATGRGIFGLVNGTVKNLVVSNCSIVADQNIGAIAGKLVNGTIENCHVGKDVTLSVSLLYAYAGGIVGESSGGSIKGCTIDATITGTTGAHILGGIAGHTSNSSKLTDNIFTGTIAGNLGDYIGAIVGENASGDLTNNHYTSTGFGGIGAESPAIGADGDGARKALTISAATGVTITPTGNATTYNVSGIKSYAGNKGLLYNNGTTETLYAGDTDDVKLSIAYTAPSGYEFDKIDAGEGVTVTASGDDYIVTMPASNVTVKVVYKAIEYKLTYNLAGGALAEGVSNPTTYTVESDAITLKNPTREGYAFEGWTGTGLTEATTTVTIAKGSTGDRAYTATWLLADYTITYDLAGGALAEGVSNPAGYNIDSDDITLNNPTREGYTFTGWTGTGLTEATITVTIAKGSHENKTYTATWEKNPDTRYEVDDDGVAVTTMAYLAELALDDTMEDYVKDGKLKATVTPKNKYWTLACGVDLLVPEGVKVYKARMNSTGTKVELTEIDATTLGGVLKANNGVVIASTPGQSYDLVVSPNNSVTTLSTTDAKSYGNDNELEPVLEETHFTTEDYFILTENKFVMVDISKDTKVPAGKAVLKVPAGSAKTRSIEIDGDGTTGISSAVNSGEEEVWYNLQGQRISKPTRKGIYIINGKKVRK